MPRRRPSQKAKLHKKPRPVDRAQGKLKRWNTAADIELDEEDQFHASRDKILLDEGADDADEDADEEEVFALQGISPDSDYSSDGGEAELVDEEDSDDMEVDELSRSKSSKTARDTKKSSKTGEESDSEEEETWGRSKGVYYSSNAAELDSEDEEANELEEQEALKLQAKAREGLCDEDFGLADTLERDTEPSATEQEELPKLLMPKVPQDKQTILRTLEKEYSETLALARDWEDTTQNLVEAKARVEALQNMETDALEFGLQHMYYQALLTYATTLAFYLYMRATDKYAARPELLRRHPILKRLLSLKEGIHTLESLGVGQDVSEEDAEDEDEEELTDQSEQDGNLWSLIKKKGLESGELADLLEDASLVLPTLSPRTRSRPNANSSPQPPSTRQKKQKAESTLKEDTLEHASKKKKRRPADAGQTVVFDLVEPDYDGASRKSKHKLKPSPPHLAKHAHAYKAETDAADPYGEMTALQQHDLSDKQARKKSLRFYVSRIESSSTRRANARTNAIGGDDDIPYRERRKERETRLNKETEKRKETGQLGEGGDDLDGADLDISAAGERKRKRALEDEDESEDAGCANGYYDLVKQATAAKKARKKAAYEAATARPSLEQEVTSGPRSVTRVILKNKGLTPHRSKAVRNPRVKKRQKYEQAKKKVASQKAVYKGGIRDISKYSGEQSGISKVVKTVRL